MFSDVLMLCYVTHTGQVSAYFLLLIYSVGVAAIHSTVAKCFTFVYVLTKFSYS